MTAYREVGPQESGRVLVNMRSVSITPRTNLYRNWQNRLRDEECVFSKNSRLILPIDNRTCR